MKKILKAILIILLLVIIAAALFLAFLTIREYNPDASESVDVANSAEKVPLKADDEISILTWNTGYSALGKETDFVMDGGGNAPAADKDQVLRYISGMKSTMDDVNADIVMLQEVELNSSRSYHIDQTHEYDRSSSAFALNYSCDFVPFPWPPFGMIHSGVFTTTDYEITDATRLSLPCPFTWPLRVANLKRCLLATYIPVEGTDRQLVVVNHHLEAYDSGEGKIAQTKKLLEFVTAEYEKGNWVIAGGDWNQVFPGSLEKYPNTHEKEWAVGVLEESILPEGWQFAYDMSVPTCRLLNQPYDPSDTAGTQYYVIDGFMLSPNVTLETVETLNEGFENTDHNPVLMKVSLS